VEELANFTTEMEPPDHDSARLPISRCSDFILSLKPEVQQFVFEAVRCQEMVMPPIDGDFGPAQLFPPLDEIEASEYEAEQTALKDDRSPSSSPAPSGAPEHSRNRTSTHQSPLVRPSRPLPLPDAPSPLRLREISRAPPCLPCPPLESPPRPPDRSVCRTRAYFGSGLRRR
jgi:hypothetical protein